MARPVIDIDVNDDKFKAFQKEFEKYQEALKKLPGAWGETDKAVEGTAGTYATMTAALLAQQELLATSVDHHHVEREAGRPLNPPICQKDRLFARLFGVCIEGRAARWPQDS